VVLFILYKKQIIFKNNSPVKVTDLSMSEIHGLNQKNSELKESYRGDKFEESVDKASLMPKTTSIIIN
jgi:hypothetical protein